VRALAHGVDAHQPADLACHRRAGDEAISDSRRERRRKVRWLPELPTLDEEATVPVLESATTEALVIRREGRPWRNRDAMLVDASRQPRHRVG
jgi:hypothetical protein